MCARSHTNGAISGGFCARRSASSIGSSRVSVRARARSSSAAACFFGSGPVTVARLPAPLDPLVEVGALGADGGVEPVARQHEVVPGQRVEAAVDRLDDLVKVAVLELR